MTPHGSTTGPERGELLYTPTADSVAHTMIELFRRWAEERSGCRLEDERALWSWSVSDLGAFWDAVADFFDLDLAGRGVMLERSAPQRVTWLPGAKLSYVHHALRRDFDGPALIGLSQTRDRVELSMPELRQAVSRCRAGLRALGVGSGDRVVGYLPNIPEAVIAFLATASLGAVWACCPPEFGAKAVVDRLAQIEPRLLLTVDGYRYGDKRIDRGEVVAAIRRGLPTLQHTVHIDYLDSDQGEDGWHDLLDHAPDHDIDLVDFDHPLYVLFSSGTTGLPKAIVHGHGGILLEHAKALGLHNDVRPGDRFFWHSTTGWMVWNYAVSALLHGASMVCFDGHPAFRGPGTLWEIVASERVTYFGTSAGHLETSARAELTPGSDLDLSSLRGVGSTGSPLPAHCFRWVYDAVKPDLVLSSASGGTDICSAFVGGSPLSAVRAGEISSRMLGCNAAALDAGGRSMIDEFGELSILDPMPSMPVGLYGDDDGSRLRETYFHKHAGVWSHGDWALFHLDGSCVISGRSDATLNRGGVRLGTSEFYSVLDRFPDIEDSVVVHLEGDGEQGPGELVLLAAVSADVDETEMSARVRNALRDELSPRHVPDRLVIVGHLPRTLTGKRLEKPIKQILLGAAPESVVSADSITWPESLRELSDQAVARCATTSTITDDLSAASREASQP
ncbi:acetoacetate--CoA ligase [Gordonia terrae]